MGASKLERWHTVTNPTQRLERRRFGKEVRNLRKEYNLSRQDLADNLNVSLEAVNRIEKGYVDPNVNNLRKKVHQAARRTVMRISV
ncbi:helix-turn-helix domain-containing protein [Priestia megaterium]|uniref:helix-turn-helix domain-containing protein n=1 Tax=Priestia megaterium TaxID=1404 RepID=UPI00406BC0B5